MIEQSTRTGSVANQSHFSSRRAWQEYLHGLPQEIKAGYKGGLGRRDREVDNYLRRGGDFNDLGIKDVKEEGRARYRRMGMHNLDKSFTYDWENGVKYNVATSDDNEYMKAIPITDDDRREYAEIQRYGATPEGYAQRMRDATTNQMNSWAAQNAIKGGSLRKDEHGLYMQGDDGQRIDFDAYGNLIDANTGQRIGDNQYGFGTDLIGAAAGYKSPWSIGGTSASAPGTPPPVGITPPPLGGINPVTPYGGGGGPTPPAQPPVVNHNGGGFGAGPSVTSAPRPAARGGMGTSIMAPSRYQPGSITPAPEGGTGNAWGQRTSTYGGGAVTPRPGGWYRRPGGMGTGQSQPRPQYY